ncbi:hypothetical protein MNBD_NITROSPINAE02-1277 [hydrothermal vent metagenome]|uniref:Periplasmic heavy metal sensor n=1 Tax=hydrothermal vent metagenome TaxID=652676 RepID=A0A3B1BWN7_9ZZZZ
MRKVVLITMMVALMPMVALGGEDGKHGKGGKHGYIKELNLDEKQVGAMRDIQREMRRFMIPHHSKIELTKLNFEEELQKDKPDEAALNKIIGEMASLQAEHEKRRMEIIVKMAAILTPEQKAKFIESKMVKAIGGGSPGRHGGGHGHKPGERK